MKSSRTRMVILLFGVLLYVAILVFNLSENDRRSLRLRQDASTADQVFLAINVVSANMNTGEVRARIRFRLAGTIADDEITPAVNIKLLLNTVQGQQEYDFPSRKRMNPIEAVFSMDGDSNGYPFDRHTSELSLLITKPNPRGRSSTSGATSASNPAVPSSSGGPPVPRAAKKRNAVAGANTGRAAPKPRGDQMATPDALTVVPEQTVPAPGLVVGTAALESREPVPVSIDVSASIPGVKFSGSISAAENENVRQVNLYLRRADNVIAVSTTVMIMMMGLAISLLALVVTAPISGNENALLPVAVSVPLIFGLPALRNVQPGVPPLGVFGDYVSFIWAELIVAGSLLFVVWTWILRSRRLRRHARESATRN